MKESLTLTGNEYVSLPRIDETDGSIVDLTFLYLGLKGMLNVRGKKRLPLLTPFLESEEKKVKLSDWTWTMKQEWIPEFQARFQQGDVHGTILAPIGERGFAYRLNVTNNSDAELSVSFGFRGGWAQTFQTINEEKEINAAVYVYESGWNHDKVMDLRIGGAPTFAMACMFSDPEVVTSYRQDEAQVIRYKFTKQQKLQPGESAEMILYWGIGYEEVAAATSAKDMKRHGFQELLRQSMDWLMERSKQFEQPYISSLFHRNLYFTMFYATGRTIDTDELVLMTSRSPRYYVSAAYWDRDSLLWCFPAVLMSDPELAYEMLNYVFQKQIYNVGNHSRYIDGTLLEPGFELDELCAPIMALDAYIEKTGNRNLLRKDTVMEGIEHILSRLQSMKSSDFYLYETFLQPTDDTRTYPYLTYDNALVCLSLDKLAKLYSGIWTKERCQSLRERSLAVKNSILEHCIFEYQGRRIFAWSVDGNGNWDVYDEPPGSLRLLAYYGFCDETDEVYQNTVACIKDKTYAYSFAQSTIHEIGCPHAPHPWVLSICNALLSEKDDKQELLTCLKMDHGFACESVDEETGESTTGDAFATCAGFLAYALYYRYGKE